MATRKKSALVKMRWFLYILKCSDGTLYTGITTDLPRRVAQHNSGKASSYTRSRRPVMLIYQERCRNRSSALKKECRVKALSRKEKEKFISVKSKTLDSRQSLPPHD